MMTSRTLKLAWRLINRYPEIGDAGIILTDDDASGCISMSVIFELHDVAVNDEYNFSSAWVSWRLFSSTILCTCRSVLFSHYIFSPSSHDIISCGNNSSSSYILYNNQHSLFQNFELISSILVSCRQMISTTADYTKRLLLQVHLLV